MYRGYGISDEKFQRGGIPMTKEEVRVVALSKLRPEEGQRCLDVGCGTGSVTVELGLAVGAKGEVVGVDSHPEAMELTRVNCDQFDLQNIRLIQGKAPECLPEENFHRIFVGGGGRSLGAILRYGVAHLEPGGRMVVTAIMVESLGTALSTMEAEGMEDMGCICLNVAHGDRVSGWMMKANNPIYIIWGVKRSV